MFHHPDIPLVDKIITPSISGGHVGGGHCEYTFNLKCEVYLLSIFLFILSSHFTYQKYMIKIWKPHRIPSFWAERLIDFGVILAYNARGVADLLQWLFGLLVYQ